MTRARFYRSSPKHQRDPRRVFNLYNSKLTAPEVVETMTPLRTALTHIREGVATHIEYVVLHSTMLIAQEIENGGIVRGLQKHISAALQACATYQARCGYADNWQPSALYFQELDTLTEMLDLHEFQLKQLTAREIFEVTKRLIARTQSEGGTVYQVENDLGSAHPYKIKKGAAA